MNTLLLQLDGRIPNIASREYRQYRHDDRKGRAEGRTQMTTTLSVLDCTGDLKLTWDHSNPEETAAARATVEDLRAKGFTFFLVDGTPADEVSAGQGVLNVIRRIGAEELVAPEPDTSDRSDLSEAPDPPGRRGRKRATDAETTAAERVAKSERQIVAVPRQRGG